MFISSFFTMVDSNNSLALSVASLLPTSTNIKWRPDRSSVSGPNIGCNDVIMQSESFRAFNPSLSGVFNEPMSNISPDGFFSDNWIFLSATNASKPWELKKSTNHLPILPAPPITRTDLPFPFPSASTRSFSCLVSDERIKTVIISSAISGSIPTSIASCLT